MTDPTPDLLAVTQLLKSHQLDQAQSLLNDLLARFPDDAKVLAAAGMAALGRLCRPADALLVLDQALDLDPNYAEVHANRRRPADCRWPAQPLKPIPPRLLRP